jgi:hypothetical protein
MTFDDELDRAFATLTARLRDEVDRQARETTATLAAAARADRDRAAADADQRLRAAEDRAREEGREIGIEEGRFQGIEQARAEAGPATVPSARAADDGGRDRLADAIRSLDRARSLSEILDTLAACAGREAARAAVLVTGDERFTGWRFIGFDDTFANARAITVAAADGHIVASAARSGILAVATGGAETDAAHRPPGFAGLPQGAECIAIPIAISGHVVAVLYADQGSAPDARPHDAEHAAQWRGTLDVLGRHAARCLESIVAMKALRLIDVPRAIASESASADPADEGAAATRYARLLVSEIRVYHEDDVAAGRRERDLATRLGGEIARARVLYEQRIPPHVRQRDDYFGAELVRMLAGGDASLLEART